MKNRSLTAIVLLVLIVVSITPMSVTAIIRHEKTFKHYKLRTYDAFLRILEILISDPEVQNNPELLEQLKSLYNSLKRGDVEGANEVLSRLMEIVEDPDYLNELPLSARSLLPFISSWEVSRWRRFEISVNPEKLRRALKSIAGEPEELSKSIEAIEEAAKAVGELDPALSIRLEEVAELLKSGSYEEAAKIYFEVLAELAESMPRLLESETYDPKKLAALFSKLPISLGSLGSASSSLNFLVYLITFLEEDSGGRGVERRESLETERILLPIIDAQKALSKVLSSGWESLFLVLTALLAPIGLLLLYRVSKAPPEVFKTLSSKVSSRIEASTLNVKLALTRTVRDRIVAVYLATINVMRSRGVLKRVYETHREFASKLEGKWEKPYVWRICERYEKACFSGREVSEEDFKECLDSFRKLVLR